MHLRWDGLGAAPRSLDPPQISSGNVRLMDKGWTTVETPEGRQGLECHSTSFRAAICRRAGLMRCCSISALGLKTGVQFICDEDDKHVTAAENVVGLAELARDLQVLSLCPGKPSNDVIT